MSDLLMHGCMYVESVLWLFLVIYCRCKDNAVHRKMLVCILLYFLGHTLNSNDKK